MREQGGWLIHSDHPSVALAEQRAGGSFANVPPGGLGVRPETSLGCAAEERSDQLGYPQVRQGQLELRDVLDLGAALLRDLCAQP